MLDKQLGGARNGHAATLVEVMTAKVKHSKVSDSFDYKYNYNYNYNNNK
jgi:hypothetical protein